MNEPTQQLNLPPPSTVLFALSTEGNTSFQRFTRCCRLAHELNQTFGCHSIFWLDGPKSPYWIRLSRIYGVELIQEQWSLPEVLRQHHVDRLVIDYETPLSPTAVQALRHSHAQTTLVVLDNYGMGCQGVDVLIHGGSLPETEELIPTGFLGDAYVGFDYMVLGADLMKPLTEQHAPSHTSAENTTHQKQRILIFGGQSEQADFCEHVLLALKDIRDCHFDLIVPNTNVDKENLERIATQMQSTITLHWQVTHLGHLIEPCQLAILVYGLHVFEFLSTGTPALIYAPFPETVEQLDRYCQYGASLNMGSLQSFDADALKQQLMNVLNNPEQQTLMHKNGQQLLKITDASVVAQIIYNSTVKSVSIAS